MFSLSLGRRLSKIYTSWVSYSRQSQRGLSTFKSEIIDVEGIPPWNAIPTSLDNIEIIFKTQHEQFLNKLYARSNPRRVTHISKKEYIDMFMRTPTLVIVPFYEELCLGGVVVSDQDPCPQGHKDRRSLYNPYEHDLHAQPATRVDGEFNKKLSGFETHFLHFDASFQEVKAPKILTPQTPKILTPQTRQYLAGGGYVIRNSEGLYKSDSPVLLPEATSSFCAELLSGVVAALSVADKVEIQNLVILNDNASVIERLQGFAPIAREDYPTFCEFFLSVKRKLYFEMRHCYRETNMAADLVAKYALNIARWKAKLRTKPADYQPELFRLIELEARRPMTFYRQRPYYWEEKNK